MAVRSADQGGVAVTRTRFAGGSHGFRGGGGRTLAMAQHPGIPTADTLHSQGPCIRTAGTRHRVSIQLIRPSPPTRTTINLHKISWQNLNHTRNSSRRSWQGSAQGSKSYTKSSRAKESIFPSRRSVERLISGSGNALADVSRSLGLSRRQTGE